MPEIAEVARIVHFLKKHAVGRTIAAARTQEDTIVYGKVGTSAADFEKAMVGKQIIDAKRQGKYFWLEMNVAPHPLMHFGMTGWIKFSNEETSYYRSPKPEEPTWPPKFWKFVLELAGEPKCEIAFVDARRLARIRLVDVQAEDMRKTSPLKENGPDPVLDPDVLTTEWLATKLRSKRVPVKALLLDQANISGIGNWVGDEIMYNARLHPEQYSNTFTDAQIKQLHDSMMYICNTAVDANGESDKFPQDWLMKHRWDKGKKNSSKLPNGAKIVFLKVGGRTSAVVPSVQKKTGTVAGDVMEDGDSAENDDEATDKPAKSGKRRLVQDDMNEQDVSEANPTRKKRGKKDIHGAKSTIHEGSEDAPKERINTTASVQGTNGRRRSARHSKG